VKLLGVVLVLLIVCLLAGMVSPSQDHHKEQ